MNARHAFFGFAKWNVDEINPIVNNTALVTAIIKKVFLSISIPRFKKLNKLSKEINAYPAPDTTVKNITENAGCIISPYNSTTLFTQSLTFVTRFGSLISC